MMRLGDVARATGGWVSPESAQRVVADCVIDSRKAGKGSLFFALEGIHTDGHAFVDDVLRKDGMAVVSRGERRRDTVVVQSVEKALLDAAEWKRGTIGSKVVAITGSSGKTTTRRLLIAALECRYTVYGTTGNLNNHIGLPLVLLNAPEKDADLMVLEMGMNHAGELLVLGGVSRPHHCLITNIGRAHMEFFTSVDGVARAKAEVIRTTAPGGFCVIPEGEDILSRTAEERGLDISSFGPGGDVWLDIDDCGSCVLEPWNIGMRLALSGRHNCVNAMVAVLMAHRLGVKPEDAVRALTIDATEAAPLRPHEIDLVVERAAGSPMFVGELAAALMGQRLGVNPEDAVRAMEGLSPSGGRGRILRTDGLVILDESYNANPDSTLVCLDVLGTAEGNRAAVLGDMYELGERAPEYHREVLMRAEEIGLDLLILTGSIYASQLEKTGLTGAVTAADWREALTALRERAPRPCTVLVKGSNAMELGRLVRALEEVD